MRTVPDARMRTLRGCVRIAGLAGEQRTGIAVRSAMVAAIML